MHACWVPGQAVEVTTSTTTDSYLEVVVFCAETERPSGVLPGGTVAESLFSSDRPMIPEMEWIMVDLVNPRNLAKITIFRHPCVQN